MKYIEELIPGDVFILRGICYLVTCDFKSNGSRLCFCLSEGSPKWFMSDTIVDINPIYYLDTDNNIIPIKESKKDDKSYNIS